MIAIVNVTAMFVMYCLAIAGAEGNRSDKTAAVILFTYNLFLAFAGRYL